MAGYVTLPKLHFNLHRFQVSWDEHAQKMVPSTVFIKVSNSCMLQVRIDRIRILGIELELACTRGLCGGIFSHANSF